MTDPTGSTAYQYDRRGLLKREEKTILGVTFITAFRHDADGNRTETTYPSGTKVTYAYDFAGRPSAATAGTTPLVTSAKYQPFGPASEIAFGNGTTQTAVYDARYRIDQHTLTGPAGAVIANYDYVSDAAGNITDILDLVDDGYDRRFQYDDLNRLTVANTGDALWQTGSYSYDDMGNLETYALGTWRSGTLTYPSTTPQVAGITYDAAGNETVEKNWTRKYSPRNHMVALDDTRDAAGVRRHIGYGYDGRGVRVWRGQGLRSDLNVPDAVRRYVYSPELQLLLMTNDSRPLGFAKSFFSPLNIRSEFLWFGTTPLASLAPASEPLLYFTDHLGTPLIQTDSTGKVAWRAEYEPYGNIAVMRVGKPSDQPLRLPGQEYERTYQGAEENYNIFRWYRAGWGRYTQADPLLNPAFTSTLDMVMGDEAPTPAYGLYAWYSYASGNPVDRADALSLKDYAHCTLVGEVIKDSKYAGEVFMHGTKHSKYIIVRRWCFFRCYCDKPDNCYKIPCLSPMCHMDKDHGTSIKLNLFDKEGVKPCASQTALARKKGKC